MALYHAAFSARVRAATPPIVRGGVALVRRLPVGRLHRNETLDSSPSVHAGGKRCGCTHGGSEVTTPQLLRHRHQLRHGSSF